MAIKQDWREMDKIDKAIRGLEQAYAGTMPDSVKSYITGLRGQLLYLDARTRVYRRKR